MDLRSTGAKEDEVRGERRALRVTRVTVSELVGGMAQWAMEVLKMGGTEVEGEKSFPILPITFAARLFFEKTTSFVSGNGLFGNTFAPLPIGPNVPILDTTQEPPNGVWIYLTENANMTNIKNLLHNLAKDESGQDLIEYALVAALVGLGAVASMKTLSSAISGAFTSVGTQLTSNV